MKEDTRTSTTFPKEEEELPPQRLTNPPSQTMVGTSEPEGKGAVPVDAGTKTAADSQSWPPTPQPGTVGGGEAFAAAGGPEWRAVERRLVRKLDMTLMPMFFLLYTFNYLDRTNIAYVQVRPR
ncbi:hypothetical protein LX36DRAFT_747475 [Colletotrichum falcatum]|nr:hypothetical protein LX36DRAFT_747475 [Colletotrichum falcatum]